METATAPSASRLSSKNLTKRVSFRWTIDLQKVRMVRMPLPLVLLYVCLAVSSIAVTRSSLEPTTSSRVASMPKHDKDPSIEDLLGDEKIPDDKKDPPVSLVVDKIPNLMEHGVEGDATVEKSEGKDGGKAAPANGHSNTTKEEETPEAVFLPEEGAAEKEHSNSMAIFFVLTLLILCIFLVHFILRLRCHYLPESLVIVFLGAVVGLFMRVLPSEDMKSVESFSPTMFFLVLLPPIIFESGYNLHKGEQELYF